MHARILPLVLASLAMAEDVPLPGAAPSAALPSGTPGTDTLKAADVEVVGKRKHTGGKVVDASLSKMPAPLHETPRSVSVLPSETLRDQNIRTVAQALNYVPGVFTNGSNSAGGYHYKARGYHMPPSVYLVDGFQGVRAGGDYSPSLFGIERVVFLRGPAGLTYGAMSVPGGMVNMVTKAPQEQSLRRIDLSFGPFGANSVGFGSSSSFGIDADFAGKASQDGRLLYRAVANWENKSGYTADSRDSSRAFLGSLLWKIDEAGRYTLRPLVQWNWTSRRAGTSTLISPSTSLSTKDGSTAIDLDDLTPTGVNHSAGGRQDEQTVAGFDFRAAPNDALRLSAAYRWLSYDTEVNQWAPVTSTLKQSNGAWTIARQQTKSVTERFGHAFDVNGNWEALVTESVKNTFGAGVNGRYSGTDRSASATGRVHSPVNIRTGTYSEALVDSNLVLKPAFLTSTLAWNLYLQDQLSLLSNHLILTAGATWAGESNQRDYRFTGIDRDTVTNLAKILQDKNTGSVPVPSFGALFQVTPQWAVYGSYSTSFSLANAEYENKEGKTGEFDPMTGVNLEAGVKFDQGTTSATVSVFQVSQKDVLVAAVDKNANGNTYYVQSDDDGRESFGVELSLEAHPVTGWTSTLTGAWIDAQVKSSTDSIADGSPVDKTPEWSANLLNRYQQPTGIFKGLGASLNVNWQTSRWMATRTAAAPDPLVMPWTTVVDVGLFYQITPQVEIALNVTNLGDEVVVESGTTGSALVMGTPRTWSARLGCQF